MQERTQINHAEYQKKVRTMTNDSLRWCIKDCKEAIAALPEGHKAGYYADEINYCSTELNKRSRNRNESKRWSKFITDKNHMPAKLGNRIHRALKPHCQVEVYSAEALDPCCWDYRLLFKVIINDGIEALITMNISPYEMSGVTTIRDQGVMALYRGSDFEALFDSVIGGIRDAIR